MMRGGLTMLGGLCQEIVRRRLWPIPVLALAVVAATPLLFLEPAPDGAPTPAPASQTAPAEPEARLLARAQRLLTAPDSQPSTPRARRHRAGKGDDPFQAPAGVKQTTKAASQQDATAPATPSAGAGSGGDGVPTKPIPVVIAVPDADTGGSDAPDTPTSSTSTTFAATDVRFGQGGGGSVRETIPRLMPFSAKGHMLASFVRYSPSLEAAVFAVAPRTIVTGVTCRKEDGLCRYVDIAEGSTARLTITLPGGALLTRRLEVVHVTQRAVGSDGAGEPKAPAGGSCLLGKLLKLGIDDPPLGRDACDR